MTNRSPKKILIVTGDCPSHPYACCKLATVLAEHHEVTLAGPNVSLDRLQAEMEVYHNSANSKNKIKVESIGNVSTVVHCNVRPVINPQEYSPLQIIYNTIFNRSYNPFGIADLIEQVMDDQIGTYDNLKSMIPNYDLVYAVHSCAATRKSAFVMFYHSNSCVQYEVSVPHVLTQLQSSLFLLRKL